MDPRSCFLDLSRTSALTGVFFAEALQALLCRFELGESAALLLDDVILNPSAIFGRLEKTLPVHSALAKQN